MAVEKLSFADFKAEVQNRLDGTVSMADVGKVLSATVDEIHDCLIHGYAVSLPGLCKFTPAVKEGRKKGSVVRNPFDGSEKKLTANEPAKFVVRVGKSTALVGKFPKIATSAGKQLHAKLSK